MKGKRVLKVSILVIILALVIGVSLMFRKGNAGPIVQKELTHQQFNQIDVDVANANIEIKEGNDCRVIYNGREKMVPAVKVENSVLKVERNNGSVNINANIFDLFKKNSIVPTITIEVPKKKLNKVTIDSSNGNVTVRDVSLKRGQIDTSNGSVVVRNSMTQGYDFETFNGRITVNGQDEGDTYSKNDVGNNVLEIDTSNGNITVN